VDLKLTTSRLKPARENPHLSSIEVSDVLLENSCLRKPASKASWHDSQESQDAIAMVQDQSFDDPLNAELDESMNTENENLTFDSTFAEKSGLHFMLFDSDQHYRSNTQESLLSEISDVYLPSESLSEFGFGAWDRSEGLHPNFLSEFNDQLDLSLASNFLPNTESVASSLKNPVTSEGFNLLQISESHVRDIVEKETLPATVFPTDYVFLASPPEKDQGLFDQTTLLNAWFPSGTGEHFDFFSMLGNIPQTLSPLVQQPQEAPVLPMASFLEMMNASTEPDFKSADESFAPVEAIEQ
jgi:hypothetical protein